MQSPSSLIFLVLLGVWAAYFLQFWIRRRDHLATARSVEQFSAAMRVLERRSAIPRTDLSDPAPRSWSVHPARSARPQVVVKRAVPAVGAPALVAPRVAEGPVPMSAPSSPSPAAPSRPSVPAPIRVGPGRRVRALTLLATLVATAVVTGFAAFSLLVPVWSPVVGIAAVALALAWVRSGVRAEQAARSARRRRAVEEARRRRAASPASGTRRPATARTAAPAGSPAAGGSHDVAARDEAVVDLATSVDRDPTAAQPTETVAEAAPAAPEPRIEQPVAEVAPEPVEETRIEYVHLVDEDDIPLTWEPVPVPRPTYTMKAKAERPAVAPAAVTPDPTPVEAPLRAREDDLDVRRAAGA